MSLVTDLLMWLVTYVIEEVQSHPIYSAMIAYGIIRLFGTTVQTGWKGVLFSFGRATKELEPGFHWLIPFVQRVRKTPFRAITLHLPMQRVTTLDGLVYEAQANVVYRVVDPKKAFVMIADIRKGCEAVLPMLVQDVLRGKTRAQLQERESLDGELTAQAASKLDRWGATVEQAGFLTIAPTSKTLRLTQLEQLVQERARMVQRYFEAGLTPERAAALLGTEHKPIAHSAMRYHKRRRQTDVLYKSLLEQYLAEERQRRRERFKKIGLPASEVEAFVAAEVAQDHAWQLGAAARARRLSRTAVARRRHGASAPTDAKGGSAEAHKTSEVSKDFGSLGESA
jgi:hypothetical protein